MNPFAGPSPLGSTNPIFGRDEELRELSYLLTSQRIVVLHSPSGAGKSSLIRARDGLLERMKRNLDVFPVARVKSEAPAGVANRFVWSAITDFVSGPHSFSGFAEFAAAKIAKPSLLTIDQFEEILRVDPIGDKNREMKKDFFRQLGDMLLNGNIWALLVLREDYLAPLEDYRRMVPTHLQNRYRIDLLKRDAAEQAIQGTAQSAGRKFADNALKALSANLSKVKTTNSDGTTGERDGGYIEPLQLQVVCRDIWGDGEEDISVDEVRRKGDVGRALGNYYATAVRAASGNDRRVEYAIRQWIGTHLITPAKTRDQVRRTEPKTAGVENVFLDRLIDDAHLLRAEERLGAPWLELAHDRLIDPIVESNNGWFEGTLSECEKRARSWQQEASEGLRQAYLVTGADRIRAARWVKENPESRVDMQGYLAACDERQKEIDKEWRDKWRLRLIIAAVLIATTVASAILWQQKVELASQTAEALCQKAVALDAQDQAESALKEAKANEILAKKNGKKAQDSGEQARVAALEAEARLLLGASAASGQIVQRGLWAAASLKTSALPEAQSVVQEVLTQLPRFVAQIQAKTSISLTPAIIEDGHELGHEWVFAAAGGVAAIRGTRGRGGERATMARAATNSRRRHAGATRGCIRKLPNQLHR